MLRSYGVPVLTRASSTLARARPLGFPASSPCSRGPTGGIAIVAVGALAAILRFTAIDKAIRAVSQDEALARACGMNTSGIQTLAFGFGAALAGAAGTLVALTYVVYPQVGEVYLLRAFAVVILGGLGSISGAFVAGLLLGVAESFGTFVLTTQMGQAISYLLLVIVLLVRPRGLFGRSEES